MYFLVEQYRYRVEVLKEVFGDSLGSFSYDAIKTTAGDRIAFEVMKDGEYIKFDYVGYCYFKTADRSGCIFFIPKVVLDAEDEIEGDDAQELKQPRGRILRKYQPEDYILSKKIKEECYEDYAFLLKLSFEVCKAIRVYWQRLSKKDKKTLPEQQALSDIRACLNDRPQSLIDLLRAIEQFAIENRDYFMFAMQQSRNPQKKVSWRKTIQNTDPFMQDDTPIYLNPITIRKTVDFDEELLTIFNSILHYINDEYGLHCPVCEGYELITGGAFLNYLKGFGELRLAQIRYKYFSDKALTLWSLCDEFFKHHAVSEKETAREYLLIKGFHNVFEGIMDHLIGDDADKDIARQKKLKDGKIIDHLYKDYSLVNPHKEILFIADSKYYTIGAAIGEESRWKQFTYAADIQNERISDSWVRDSISLGYDIIPNYLISASLPEKDITDFDYEKIKENPLGSANDHLEHTGNALFSPTTKYIFRFDINFLYVITLYARDDDAEVKGFKKRFHAEVRSRIIAEYDNRFRFFWIPENKLSSGSSVKDLLIMSLSNGGYLPNIGKLYSFQEDDGRVFVMALERCCGDEEIDNVTNATIEAMEKLGYIHRGTDGVFIEEQKLVYRQ